MINMREVIRPHKQIILISLILIVCLICPHFSFADTIILKDGSKIKGLIIEDLEERVTLKVKNGIETIKREDIQSVTVEKIPIDLTLAEDGVEDQWGERVPPRPFRIDIALEVAANLVSAESKNEYYQHYLSMAEEYEEIAKSKSISELRQAGLITALLYYRISSNSPGKSVKEISRKGVERCSEELFSPIKGKIAIPYATVMSEHINLFMDGLKSEEEKKAYTDIYLEIGQDYEAEAEKLPEERIKNLRIAIDCYQIVMTYSPDEKSRLLARANYQQCNKKLRDTPAAEQDESL